MIKLLCKLLTWLLSQLPQNRQLGEDVVNLCLFILQLAVNATDTLADDELLAAAVLGFQMRE